MSKRHKIIVGYIKDWKWDTTDLNIVTVDDFLNSQEVARKRRPLRILNLCRNFSYLSSGYYCSLLAEARGDLPMPTVADILDLSRQSLYAFALPELENLLNKTIARLTDPPQEDFDLFVFFGQAEDPRFRRLAAEAFDLFRYPLLKLRICHAKQWRIKFIRPMGPHQVTAALSPFFESSLRHHLRLPGRRKVEARPALYDLAILYNPQETLAPSNPEALARFIRAGEKLRVDVELIQARDYHRLAEFDALLIRETTALDHHTFRFARKAEAEGIIVIDDPKSILRCTNKVYLWELLRANGLPMPRTVVLNRSAFNEETLAQAEQQLGYPMVLKIPDGSFSRGMFKAGNRDEASQAALKLFGKSRLILAQEFMYTSFDWRVGILAGRPLFVSKYKAAKGHWQIINHRDDGKSVVGGFETLAVEDAPEEVIDLASRAAGLIGDGLYGVDLKQNDDGVFVIEVNDNPNIDHGIEDRVIKMGIYETIIQEFIRRIDSAKAT